MQKADGTFAVKILEVNRGGAVCSAFGLKAFLPGSHYLGIPDEVLLTTTDSISSTVSVPPFQFNLI
jgi:hypothetical protein